ncbi:MAG TPA: L,D-transpeptidase [Conexibacter sp.]|nr:L,D-transpeptidase [Conexibacter sp.]
MPPGRLTRLLALVAGALVSVAVVAGSLAGSHAAPGAPAGPFAETQTIAIPPPRPLRTDPHLVRWAPVNVATVARSAPRAGAPAVAKVARRTPEGTVDVVLVLGHSHVTPAGVWLRARLPGGRVGWLPRRTLGGYTVVTTRLVVDRRRLTATLLRRGRRVFRAPVAVGRPGSPTPAGRFYVRVALRHYRSPMYGPLAFGTSARAPGVTDWPAGGFVGVHGTDRPELIPGRVSHGCIRLRNADVVRLGRLMTVGTPVTVR